MKPVDITIYDWIDYKPRVGVEMLHITGLPGWGKTSMGNTLILDCAAKGESWVVPGDRFCEWRHFHQYSLFDEIIVLVPNDTEIFYHGNLLNEWRAGKRDDILFYEIDYSQLKIMDYLPDDGKVRMVAIYDAHLEIDYRAMLWNNICSQILSRTTMLNKAVGTIFNEAGILFPQNAQGNHWKAVSSFAKEIVDARKGLYRLIFISQLQTEVMDTVRKKCIFKAFRKGWASKEEPKPIREAVPFLARNEYHLTVGGLYCKGNTIDKFIEEKELSKMIPTKINNNNEKMIPTPLINRDPGADSTVRKGSETYEEFSVSKRMKVGTSRRYGLGSLIDELGVSADDNIEIYVKRLARIAED